VGEHTKKQTESRQHGYLINLTVLLKEDRLEMGVLFPVLLNLTRTFQQIRIPNRDPASSYIELDTCHVLVIFLWDKVTDRCWISRFHLIAHFNITQILSPNLQALDNLNNWNIVSTSKASCMNTSAYQHLLVIRLTRRKMPVAYIKL
jgi:hypothetical protein